ncbi:hypothetical protein [Mucilaginibacter panaciglaebae]|uniref:Uncharacterized protein n=1 Tax=Mucilaginibacter panaciglaebae TaxID=502331 RepID=A0ABP7WZL9_9SPHI
MITSTDHFKPQRDIIADLLLTEGQQPRTTYFCHKNHLYKPTKEELSDWYINNFASFPLYTSEKNDGVAISNSFQRKYRKYHELEELNDTQTEHRKELDGLERDSILLDLGEYIDEWIDNIFLDFAKAITALKNGPVFACINDDLIIMKNLVNFYIDIRKEEDTQLNFFNNVFIPKAVADQMTEILIALLTDRIKMHEPTYYTSKSTPTHLINQSNFKINWLASQQEFAELIHELTDKGYISLPDMSMSMQANNLVKFFDFSASQRKEGSNIANNILTALKPIFDKDDKKETYNYLKSGYVQKFNTIPLYIPKKNKRQNL